MPEFATCKRCDASGETTGHGRSLILPDGWWSVTRQRAYQHKSLTVGFYCGSRCLVGDVWERVVHIEKQSGDEAWSDILLPDDDDPHVCSMCGHQASAPGDAPTPGGWYYLHRYSEGASRGLGIICSAACAAERVAEWEERREQLYG